MQDEQDEEFWQLWQPGIDALQAGQVVLLRWYALLLQAEH